MRFAVALLAFALTACSGNRADGVVDWLPVPWPSRPRVPMISTTASKTRSTPTRRSARVPPGHR